MCEKSICSAHRCVGTGAEVMQLQASEGWEGIADGGDGWDTWA